MASPALRPNPASAGLPQIEDLGRGFSSREPSGRDTGDAPLELPLWGDRNL
ncbi:hypothetical protein [Brasilonema octagenarum]|uniref:hypothetical protein n=1 Tax=Brasilonema octagenarum TaxID=417105 RepID=UPI001B7D2821|nr:hypothetical protein [Brasilonema octagenarum]